MASETTFKFQCWNFESQRESRHSVTWWILLTNIPPMAFRVRAVFEQLCAHLLPPCSPLLRTFSDLRSLALLQCHWVVLLNILSQIFHMPTMSVQFQLFGELMLTFPPKDLEPYISEEIMRLHHTKHHQTYVNALNAAEAAYAKADSTAKRIALQPTLKFNGGGL